MLTSVRSLMAATILATTALAATPAFAQDEETNSTGLTVSGSATITSDYRFRGVSLSGGDPAVQGGITVSHESGVYVGTWGSSIDGGDLYGQMEMDLFAGWTGEVSDGVAVDVGVLLYAYPTNDAGPADYWEPYASISGQVGPVSAKLGVAYAFDQESLGDNDNFYIYTNFDAAIPTTPITISAHLGFTDGVLAPPLLAGDLTDETGIDWSLGASITVLPGLTASATYLGVEGPSIDGFTDDTVVATLTFAM